jgi:hypothetical protein
VFALELGWEAEWYRIYTTDGRTIRRVVDVGGGG